MGLCIGNHPKDLYLLYFSSRVDSNGEESCKGSKYWCAWENIGSHFCQAPGQAGFGGFQLMEITVATAGTSRYREKGDLSQTASTL